MRIKTSTAEDAFFNHIKPLFDTESGMPQIGYPAYAGCYVARDTARKRRGWVVMGFPKVATGEPLVVFHVGARWAEGGDRHHILGELCRLADECEVMLSLSPEVYREANQVEDRSGYVNEPKRTWGQFLEQLGFTSAGVARSIGAGVLPRPWKSMSIDTYAAVAEMKALVSCWPGGAKAVADIANIKLSRLNAYLAAKKPLEGNELGSLRTLLDVRFDCSMAQVGVMPRMVGSYVLSAANATSRQVDSIYTELSHGGDLLLSCELLPDKGPKDRSRRFLVFSAHGQNVSMVVFPVGCKNESLLDDDETLINYSGQLRVKRVLYDRVRLAADTAHQCPSLAAQAGVIAAPEWFALTDRLEEVHGISMSLCQVGELEDPALAE